VLTGGEALREGSLVKLTVGKRGSGVDVYAVWPQARHLPSKVRVAVDELAAGIPQFSPRLNRDSFLRSYPHACRGWKHAFGRAGKCPVKTSLMGRFSNFWRWTRPWQNMAT
jgi:hypothetical protein